MRKVKLGYSGTLILVVIITIAMWSWINPRLNKDGWEIGKPATEQELVVSQDPFTGDIIIGSQRYKINDTIVFSAPAKEVASKGWFDREIILVDP